MPEFVKHENFFSRLSTAKKCATDLLNDALYCVRQAIDEEDEKTRVHYCEIAMIDLQTSLRYQGYVTDVEKRADEVIEQIRQENEEREVDDDCSI